LAGKAGGVAAPSAPGVDAARSHPATTSRLRRPLAACALIGLAFLSRCELISPVSAAEPQSPRAFVDTVYRPSAGRRLLVRAGGQLQLALNAAQPGDTIVLESGATFRGNFILPKKGGSGWIIVRSGASDALLPPPGVRAGPDTAAVMAKMVTPNSSPVIVTAPGAHHYRFIGVEFTVGKNVGRIGSIVAFGGRQARASDTPHHLVLDRCYVHGHRALDGFRGVLLNSGWSAIIDSHISEMHVRGFDSQAILGYNGPGPFKIVNNYLEGAGENIMFGGADPLIRDLVPSDIQISGNRLTKPPAWDQADPSYNGVSWTMKNLLELKNAQRVLVEGNVLENVFGEGGAALLLTPRNQENSAPWSVVQDVVFRNNIVRNVSVGAKIQGSDEGFPSQRTRRIVVSNNLWLGVSRSLAYLIAPIDDLMIEHNTAIPLRHSTYHLEGDPPLTRFRLVNNVLGFGLYGLHFARFGKSEEWFPGAMISGNALIKDHQINGGQHATRSPDAGAAGLPGASGVRVFEGPAAAGLGADGHLSEGSPLKRAPGPDAGVNFDELCRAAGCEALRE
jgi:hypothetical protein